MSDPAPSAEDVTAQIRSSDHFSELVEETAEHFYDQKYKDNRIPEIKASFREDAEDAGLSEGEAKGVAGRLIGTLMQRAGEKAPPPPENKWDALETGGGPLPENRYEDLPGPLFRLLRLVETEEKPFRQVHRLIDAVEWAIKWHTTLALSDLLALGDVPDQVKVLLAQSLRTPSLGTWNRFFREATRAFEQIEAEPSLPWTRFERLTDLESRHHLVSFRNQYGHGATPPPAACRQDVEQYLPVLKELIHTPLFTEIGLAVRGASDEAHRLVGSDRKPVDVDLDEGHAAALLPEASERETLDLWPLGVCAKAETDSGEAPRFFFFNALKNRSVDQLNYEGPVHRRDEDLYDPFFERLPLRAWRDEASAELKSFAREVAALTESFKGRREERARLRGFAASGEGTLMVYGAPGIGKSALLAQVVCEIEAGVDADGRDLTDEDGNPVDPPPVIEYFIRRSEGRDDPVRFLRYLCRHLDERYDLDGQGLGSEPVELQEQLSARLQAIEENASEDEGQSQPERTVLLVDGLDEASELGRYVPEARPWLPVIVASRETPEATEFYEGRRRETRSQMTVGPLGTREVRAILYEGANKYDPAFDEEYVEAVAERSEGNPLYLTLLAEELFQGTLEVGNADALPDKIEELYGKALRRITDEGDNQTALNLLHLLVEAKAPLTAGAIAEYLEINAMQASSAERDAMELLHEASPESLYPTGEDAPEEAVQLFHESLREWLREEHTAACREMKKRLAEKTADWGKRRNETARRYALRYGALHQREAGKPDELYDLLTGESYQDEQVSTFKQYEATFASYEAGLEAYVERDGETPEDDARLCRLALDAGQAAREAKEGVTQAFRWAEDGRMEDALQRIEVLGEEKYFLAALRLLWIEADRQAERPEEEHSAEKAQKVLDAVEERIPPGTEAIDWSEFASEDFMAWWAGRVLRTLPSVDVTALLLRTSELETLSVALANRIEIGHTDVVPEALGRTTFRIAKSIDNDSNRTEALTDLIRALIEIGNFKEALRIATIHRDLRNEVLPALASFLADVDDFNEALNTAQSIDGNVRRAKVLSDLASSLAKIGASKRALDTSRSINLDRDRAKSLSELAFIFSKNGNVEQALKAHHFVKQTDTYSDTYETLSNLAVTLTDSKNFERALEISRSIRDDNFRVSALSFIAKILVETGRLDQALDVADSFYQGRDEILSEVVSALIDTGTFDQALDTAQSIDSDQRRAETFTRVASSLAEAGLVQQAQTARKQALEAVRSIPSYSDRIETLLHLVPTLADSDNRDQVPATFEEIINIAQSANSPYHRVEEGRRAEALSRIASAFVLANPNVFEQDVNIAGAIDSNFERAKVLTDLAQNLANAGDAQRAQAAFDLALDAAQSIDLASDRAETLARVAAAFADTGETGKAQSIFDQALVGAHSIEDSQNRTRIFSYLTLLFANTGYTHRAKASYEQVFNNVHPIDFGAERNQTLFNLAAALVDIGDYDQAINAFRSIDASENRSEFFSRVACAMVDAGALDHAFNAAQSVTHDLHRAKVFSNITNALIEAGEEERARLAFKQAINALQTVDSGQACAKALSDLTYTLAEFDSLRHTRVLLEQVLDIASSIGVGTHRARALSKIAAAFAYAGEIEQARSALEQALDTVEVIEVQSDRAEALRDVASVVAEESSLEQTRDLFDRALNIAGSTDSGVDRAEVFTDLAQDLANAGDVQRAHAAFDHALDAAQSIESDSDRAEALRTIAFTLANLDVHEYTHLLLDQVFDAAQSISNFPTNFHRDEAFGSVACALANTGQFNKALETARSIDWEPHRADALSEVASALTDAGSFQQTRPLFEQTLDAARSINSDDDRSQALSSVAFALARAGSFEQAVDAAQSINSDNDRSQALSSVASALAEDGQFEQSENALEQALGTARSLEDALNRSRALSKVAKVASALSETGSFQQTRALLEQTLDAARSIDPEEYRAEALSKLASALAQTGPFDQALNVAQSIDSGRPRADALSEVAPALAQTGAFDKALDVARSIDGDFFNRTRALLDVASALAEANAFDRALEAVHSIADLFWRTSAVRGIARQQTKEGHAGDIAEHLPAVELAHDGWTDLLSTWREALLEHEENPRPLLRRSFTLYPFAAEAAAEGVYSLVQAHVQAGAMDHAEAIAEACPELELDVLVQEPDLPIPEGCDPENLTGFFEQQFEDLVESYEHGDLDDAAFKENAENIFKMADLE